MLPLILSLVLEALIYYFEVWYTPYLKRPDMVRNLLLFLAVPSWALQFQNGHRRGRIREK